MTDRKTARDWFNEFNDDCIVSDGQGYGLVVSDETAISVFQQAMDQAVEDYKAQFEYKPIGLMNLDSPKPADKGE